MKFERPRGTRDFVPEEMEEREYFEKTISDVIEGFNYRKILFPVFEHTQLFQVKSGEEIGKHMYVFEDKGGRSLCLRPEATASVARMYATELRNRQKPVKVYYSCPMYRYERPQKNRYREFWQTGVELIGPSSVYADVEVIQVACECLNRLGVDYTLEVGHVGILKGLLDKLDIKEEEQDRITALIDKGDTEGVKRICDDSRLLDIIGLKGASAFTKAKNILEEIYGEQSEILDGVFESFEKEKGFMRPPLRELEEIDQLLAGLGIRHEINLGIVRGLAYYTGMVFEIRVPGLGAEDQVCGGGRYDDLIGLFGGPPTPAVGFAFGFDRVVDALKSQGVESKPEKHVVVVAPVNDEMRRNALYISGELRKKLGSRFRVELDLMGRKLGSILEYASSIGARYVIVLGPNEWKDDKVVLRDMENGDQKVLSVDEVANMLLDKH